MEIRGFSLENQKHNQSQKGFNRNDQREKYRRSTSIIHAIQRPCVFITSFCLSFLLFSLLLPRNQVPPVVSITLLVLGIVCLLVAIITGRIEKKLFRKYINEISVNTQQSLKNIKKTGEKR